MLSKVNWSALMVILVYPFVLLYFFKMYAAHVNVGAFEVGLLVLGYYGSNISVGIGLHRLWAHNSFKTNKVVEFILALLTAGTLQGPVLAWASDHFKHHTYTDTERDPHTPKKFDNKILGFLWAHVGWMLFKGTSLKSLDKVTVVKLGRNKLLLWQLNNYWTIAAFMNTAAPAIVGCFIGGFSLQSAVAGYLFIGIGRCIQQHATFCVNSLCHFFGKKPYSTGTAGDIWWMAAFLLGENWHNFHHAFPSDYRNGHKWYHADVHKWIIYLMSKLGLAYDLNITPKARVDAKIQDTKNQTIEIREEELVLLRTKLDSLAKEFYAKFSGIENHSASIINKIQKSYEEISMSLSNLKTQLQSAVKVHEKSSEKVLKMARAKVDQIEASIKKLMLELERVTI